MKSKNILKVINNFKKVLPLATAEDHLNMMEGDVNQYLKCGTVHCHAGWYAIATCDTTKVLSYYSGVNKMVEDLEIEDPLEENRPTALLIWANINDRIWGNDNGGRMFTTRLAFYEETKRPEGARNLQDIIDHWTEVYYRLKEREELADY